MEACGGAPTVGRRLRRLLPRRRRVADAPHEAHLPRVALRLLVLHPLPLLPLLVKPAAHPRLGEAALVLEHRAVIEVRQFRDPRDEALAVVGELRHDRVALQVQNLREREESNDLVISTAEVTR